MAALRKCSSVQIGASSGSVQGSLKASNSSSCTCRIEMIRCLLSSGVQAHDTPTLKPPEYPPTLLAIIATVIVLLQMESAKHLRVHQEDPDHAFGRLCALGLIELDLEFLRSGLHAAIISFRSCPFLCPPCDRRRRSEEENVTTETAK